ARLTGAAALDCASEALEKPGSLATPFPFPEKNVLFSVKIDGADVPASYLGHTLWGESQNEPGIGTAWLLVLDADAHTADVLDEFGAVARRFVASLGPNDLVNIVVLGDRQVVLDSRWIATKQASLATDALDSVKSTYKSPGRTRPLLSLIKQSI